MALITWISMPTHAQDHQDHDSHEHFEDEVEENAVPFTPMQEKLYFNLFGRDNRKAINGSKWNECRKPVSGNYGGSRCSSGRKIHRILLEFMHDHLPDCVEQAASSQGVRVQDFHVIHKGIYADARHSPKSLHAAGRAIDIASIVITKTNRKKVTYNFQSSSSNSFYNSLRSCWGRAVNRNNGCPAFGGRYDRTGSIGKEHAKHKHHMHLSVPKCARGSYVGNSFRR